MSMRLSVLFKNIVLLKVEQVRIKKSKPGLKEMIMQSLKQKNKKDEKMREILKKKVLEVYENQTATDLLEGDIWYNRVIANIDRILKILTA
jgi:hypothetical protein